jgi:hypothetical protein
MPEEKGPNLSFVVVDHYVVGLDIAMHDPPRMTKVQSLEKFEDVEPYVVVAEPGVQDLEICIINKLCKNRGN